MLRVLLNTPGSPWSQSWRRKGRLRWEGLAENGGFLSLERKSEGWWNTNKYKCQQHKKGSIDPQGLQK